MVDRPDVGGRGADATGGSTATRTRRAELGRYLTVYRPVGMNVLADTVKVTLVVQPGIVM
jgi:hypothetical protein